MTTENTSLDAQAIIDEAKRIVAAASDPFTGVIKFLHQRPENEPLEGVLVERVMVETFGSHEAIPQIIKAISAAVVKITRTANTIKITNQHPTKEQLGDIFIKKENVVTFDVAEEKGVLVLKKIDGLLGVEHGLEVPLDKIEVKPPKLIVTVDMGFIKPQKSLNII
ncbi:hypothetical protein KA183_13875 [bacterium]|nr:hypothetical protein [bacterium]QQR56553.1 MAG: hypothetical protein IPG59_16295 [Candidatus Melainabacteria bacterium]